MEQTNNSNEKRYVAISSMLSRQGAMLEEFRAVIPYLKPDNARASLRTLIFEDNVLRRPSLSSRQEIHRKLAERYFREDTPLATARLIQAFQSIEDPTQTGLIAYAMLVWNDGLCYELGRQWLASHLMGEPFEATTLDIERELNFLQNQYPVIKNWGSITRKRTARHYLSLLRDCGFAHGVARKSLHKPYIAPSVILFITQLLIQSGELSYNIVEHPVFQTLGLSVPDVIDGLTDLNGQGLIRFYTQGSVVVIEIP